MFVYAINEKGMAPSVSAWLGFPSKILCSTIWGSIKKTSGSMILSVGSGGTNSHSSHHMSGQPWYHAYHSLHYTHVPTSYHKQRTNLQQNTPLLCQLLCLSYYVIHPTWTEAVSWNSSSCKKPLTSCTNSITADVQGSHPADGGEELVVIITWDSGLCWLLRCNHDTHLSCIFHW